MNGYKNINEKDNEIRKNQNHVWKQENYYWDPAGDGCKPCSCNLANTELIIESRCGMSSGECNCKPGFDQSAGCSQCAPLHFARSEGECTPCSCAGMQTCDSTGGMCACPPNTEGADCDLCVSGFWGLDSLRFTGCKVLHSFHHLLYYFHYILCSIFQYYTTTSIFMTKMKINMVYH